MDSTRPFLIPLEKVGEEDEQIVGGKAAKLGRLVREGFAVPQGFCLTTWAYDSFVDEQKITSTIQMELERKSMDDMRWEEIWDAALRIRSAFLAQPLTHALKVAITDGLQRFQSSTSLAIRSSAIGEDSAGRSFAGLHESIVGVNSADRVEDAVRLVWASLWSDAALLYRKELGLDPTRSRMAVLVQEVVHANRSGVAFSRDPRDTKNDRAIIESVPGPCGLLVDGVVDPDRWAMSRKSGKVLEWVSGEREGEVEKTPLLAASDLRQILDTILSIEGLFRWSADMEWTGQGKSLTVLQARPITTSTPNTDDKRSWYLTLRPGDAHLQKLRKRVVEELIPQLAAEGDALAAQDLEVLDDVQLAGAIENRSSTVSKWKKIYWDDFIPFAHGVRRLATYYNDAVRPDDPYEFVGVLRDQPLLAAQRNHAIAGLARQLAANDELRRKVESLLSQNAGALNYPLFCDELLRAGSEAKRFWEGFDTLSKRFLDVAYDDQRLRDQPEPLIRNIVELSRCSDKLVEHETGGRSAEVLRKRLLAAVGPERHDEAREVIETGRVSWKLRDDDNLLVARLESQLLRSLTEAATRLRALGRLVGTGHVDESHAEILAEGLREPRIEPIKIDTRDTSPQHIAKGRVAEEVHRQLVGQPASPGVATGTVRRVHGRQDLGKFQQGEVLVCDAIQPTMTHLVPLASAIVERRGGMLIHGAIIARELGIPCVNGVRKAADVLNDGDLVTVDGYLGIVTVGTADFDLELRG